MMKNSLAAMALAALAAPKKVPPQIGGGLVRARARRKAEREFRNRLYVGTPTVERESRADRAAASHERRRRQTEAKQAAVNARRAKTCTRR